MSNKAYFSLLLYFLFYAFFCKIIKFLYFFGCIPIHIYEEQPYFCLLVSLIELILLFSFNNVQNNSVVDGVQISFGVGFFAQLAIIYHNLQLSIGKTTIVWCLYAYPDRMLQIVNQTKSQTVLSAHREVFSNVRHDI